MLRVKKSKMVCNAAGRKRGSIDPSRTATMRRLRVQHVRKLFAALKRRVRKLVVEEDAFGLVERKPYVVNCAAGQMRGADGRCGPGIGRSIPREQMPQIIKDDMEEFLRYCDKQNVRWGKEETNTEDLSPTQAQFRQERVDAIPDKEMSSPILVSKDDYILDGTHRWVKNWQRNRKGTVNTIKLYVDLDDALKVMREFPKAKFVANSFCPTGEGGGVDPTCSPSGEDKSIELTDKSIAADYEKKVDGKIAAMKAEGKGGKELDAMWRISGALAGGRRGEPVILVKDADDNVVAAANLHIKSGVVKIHEMGSVQPGAGSDIMRRIIDKAKKSGAKQVIADASQDMIKLGKKFGFTAGKVNDNGTRITLVLNVTTNARDFSFHSDPDKIKAFQEWLARHIKGYITSQQEEELWREYAKAGWRKGAGRAYEDYSAKKKSRDFRKEKLPYYQGSKDEFLRSSFSAPESVDKIKLLASRSFEDLKGVTDSMATRMRRTLTDGLVEGRNPRDIAKGLSEDIDIHETRAEVIARTEIIRAHAEGQLDAFEKLGVTEIGVEVEWSTAGDDRVCDECADMEGEIYSVEDAHGMIPLHPNCRCSFLPLLPAELTENKFRSSPPRPRFYSFQRNSFCPTGEGGGIDPSCGKGGPPLDKGKREPNPIPRTPHNLENEIEDALERFAAPDTVKEFIGYSATEEQVSIDQLTSPQGVNRPEIVKYFEENPDKIEEGKLPLVIQYGKHMFLRDGNSRTTASIRLGKTTIKARVVFVPE